ncbi:UDP-glucose 4-epimerase GalE [Chenggangzhangella methanolivorans]|uniref:UDP-glucose 4-epimerase n=1 Tax=Chenggangzhangella methanolivorans TaxID=1437009 RepID=A0A9E6UQJ7_9HYPH|nr:UDP-glucose 4-epimerase GalE [Chenggangzhangella methanolivorans]QZO01040.1 UDP-glucose 4-epimerase GalE [Chenggangzhangella methanolivorans]
MAVLITGGAGYIGSHMVHALSDAGEACVVLDDLSTGSREALPEGVPLVVGDVGDQALVRRLAASYGVDAVAHFAARIVAPESVADPVGYYVANTGRTLALLGAVRDAGVRRFIFSSTAAVYGVSPPTPTREDAPLAPASPYGASKMMSERILADVAAAHGIEFVTLRYFNVAGADPLLRTGQRLPGATNLITVAIRAALGLNRGLEVYGTNLPTPDGTGVRDYIHVRDLANAHVAALGHLRAGGRSLTLNCGYGWGYSVRDVIASVKRVSGVDFPVTARPARPGDPYVSIADAGAIREALGWRPERADLDLIVGDALRFEQRWRANETRRPAKARRRAG